MITEIIYWILKVIWRYCGLYTRKRIPFLYVCELEGDIWADGTAFQNSNKRVSSPVDPLLIHMYAPLLYRVLLGSVKEDHRSLLEDLRAASSSRTPLNKVLDAHQLTEQYR